MISVKAIILFSSISLLSFYSAKTNNLGGGWRITESNFEASEIEAYYAFSDSTIMSFYVMEGIGLMPLGDESQYSYSNNLILVNGGLSAKDSIRTFFVSETKLLLMSTTFQDTVFLVREEPTK